MPIPFIVGGLIAAIGVATSVAVYCYWDDIKEWLHTLFDGLKRALAGIAHAAKVFGKKLIDNVIAFISKVYYKQNNKWYEETTTRQIEECNVPSWAIEEVQSQEETDVTQTLKYNLGL